MKIIFSCQLSCTRGEMNEKNLITDRFEVYVHSYNVTFMSPSRSDAMCVGAFPITQIYVIVKYLCMYVYPHKKISQKFWGLWTCGLLDRLTDRFYKRLIIMTHLMYSNTLCKCNFNITRKSKIFLLIKQKKHINIFYVYKHCVICVHLYVYVCIYVCMIVSEYCILKIMLP